MLPYSVVILLLVWLSVVFSVGLALGGGAAVTAAWRWLFRS